MDVPPRVSLILMLRSAGSENTRQMARSVSAVNRLGRWRDVEVDPEHVLRIVDRLCPGEPGVGGGGECELDPLGISIADAGEVVDRPAGGPGQHLLVQLLVRQ